MLLGVQKMTNMTDKIRILLKAYGEELTLEQITKILANRNEKFKDEIKQAIPELLAANLINQTADNTYKTACENRPNFFYVFQNLSYMKELSAECLFCPHSPDNHTYPFWESIGDVRKGDVIFHEFKGSVVAISEAQSEARNANKPYDLDKPEAGRVLNTLYVVLQNQVEPCFLKEELLPAQPEKLGPFDRNGKGKEGYLFNFNDECAKIIINGILKNAR